jgi:hypothetical protein
MGDAVYSFLLFVNQEARGFFERLEEAQNAPAPHMLSQEELQIRDTSASVSMAPSRIWNYRYDRKQWIEMMQG